MLNAIIKKLNGHGSEVASLEAALVQLARDRADTDDTIAGLHQQRHTALMDDEVDAAIDKLDRLIDRATVRLEKLNLAEPPSRERLMDARSEARRQRWNELHHTYIDAAADFLASARATIAKHNALVDVVATALRESYAGEVASTMPGTPQIKGAPLLTPELLDIFERAIGPPIKPASTHRSVRAVSAESPSTHHAVRLGADDRPIPKAARAADDLMPLEPGQVRARVLMSGYSPADDRPQCAQGQLIRMSRDIAEQASRSGAIDIIESAPLLVLAASAEQPSQGATT